MFLHNLFPLELHLLVWKKSQLEANCACGNEEEEALYLALRGRGKGEFELVEKCILNLWYS